MCIGKVYKAAQKFGIFLHAKYLEILCNGIIYKDDSLPLVVNKGFKLLSKRMVMILLLTDFGYKLSKNKDKLVITYPNEKEAEYQIKDIEAVYLAGEGRLSKSILIELMNRNIDVLFLSKTGKPLAYVIPAMTEPRIWKFWQKQFNLDEKKKMFLARNFALNAIKSKADILTFISRDRKRTDKERSNKIIVYRNRIRGLEKYAKNLKIKNYEESRMKLMGLEGFSARLYFEALRLIIPESLGYNGLRTKKPPKDLFNAAISYGYGFLKYFVEKQLIMNGINPYYGFLHKQVDKTKSFLTFDMMEGFRHIFIDRAIISMISRRTLSSKHCKKEKDGVYLNRNGIKLILKKLHEERNKKYGKLINEEVKDFINFINFDKED